MINFHQLLKTFSLIHVPLAELERRGDETAPACKKKRR